MKKILYCVKNYNENGRWYDFESFEDAKKYCIMYFQNLLKTPNTENVKLFIAYCECYKITKEVIDIPQQINHTFFDYCGIEFKKEILKVF